MPAHLWSLPLPECSTTLMLPPEGEGLLSVTGDDHSGQVHPCGDVNGQGLSRGVVASMLERVPSPSGYSVLSSPLSSPARRSLPLRRQSTPSARRRSATWRLRRGSPRA